MQINYAEINARAIGHILTAKKHVPTINDRLKAILELRVSQINGCAFCIDLHSEEARAAGESQQRLDCLSVWQECGLFSEKEQAALAWSESLTRISETRGLEGQVQELAQYFSEAEIVDMTYVIALMNCLNRISISMGDRPEPRVV